MAPLVPPRPAHPPPPNWPSEVYYLTAPFYSNLPPAVTSLVRSANPPPVHKPSSTIEIRLITDVRHPAFGQRGLFAKKKLTKGELVVWYTGHVHLDPEPTDALNAIRKASDYDLTLCSTVRSLLPLPPSGAQGEVAGEPEWAEKGLAVDASLMGNESRMINDYRGTPPPASASPASAASKGRSVGGAKKPAPQKAKPNVFFYSLRTTSLDVPKVLKPDERTPQERRTAGGAKGELRMGVFVLADEGIQKGEEILISYGKSFWRSRMGGGDS